MRIVSPPRSTLLEITGNTAAHIVLLWWLEVMSWTGWVLTLTTLIKMEASCPTISCCCLPSSPLSRLMLNFLHSKCCRCFAKGLMIKMESVFFVEDGLCKLRIWSYLEK